MSERMAEDRWLRVLNLGLTEFNRRGAERTENEHGDGGSNRLGKMLHGGGADPKARAARRGRGGRRFILSEPISL